MSQFPSAKALIPFVSVENMMRLVHHVGVETMLVELTDAIEADFRRWDVFDKTPRIASHSRDGVIGDADVGRRDLWLQICKRPSEEHGGGVSDRDRIRTAGAGVDGISGSSDGNDVVDGVAHRRDFGDGRKVSGS